MADWVAPVLAALIAAGAVFATNLFNSRSARAQRQEDRAERASDRVHERDKWRAERDADQRQWLLDRRSEAYINLWEWYFRDEDDSLKAQSRSIIDVRLRAYGSQSLMHAYTVWADTEPLDDGSDPTWQEVAKRMRDDLGSNGVGDIAPAAALGARTGLA